MPGQVVAVNLGGCGNRVGSCFWKQIAKEHGIHPSGMYTGAYDWQLDCIETYFEETRGCIFIPRCVLGDTTPDTLDEIRSGNYGDLYQSSNIVFTNIAAEMDCLNAMSQMNNFEALTGTTRRMMERCNRVDCLQLFHSFAGGAGAGLSVELANQMKTNDPKLQIQTFSHFWHSEFQKAKEENLKEDVVYRNQLTSLAGMVSFADSLVGFENHAVMDCIHHQMHLDWPRPDDINHLIAAAIVGMTVPWRFAGLQNNNYRKLMRQLTPMPTLKLHSLSFAPALCAVSNMFEYRESDVVTKHLLSNQNILTQTDIKKDVKIIAGSIVFRGPLQQQQCEEGINEFYEKNEEKLYSWSPRPFVWQHDKNPMKDGPPRCGSMVINSTDCLQVVENCTLRIGNPRVGKISMMNAPFPSTNITQILDDYKNLPI